MNFSKYAWLVLFTFFALGPGAAQAQTTVNILQDLDFGEWIVMNTQTPLSIQLAPNGAVGTVVPGAYTPDPGLFELRRPEIGVYEISNMLDGVGQTIQSVTVLSGTLTGGGKTFDIDIDSSQIDYDPAGIVDENTVVTVRVGGTITTTAGGYGDDTYQGTMTLQFNY